MDLLNAAHTLRLAGVESVYSIAAVNCSFCNNCSNCSNFLGTCGPCAPCCSNVTLEVIDYFRGWFASNYAGIVTLPVAGVLALANNTWSLTLLITQATGTFADIQCVLLPLRLTERHPELIPILDTSK